MEIIGTWNEVDIGVKRKIHQPGKKLMLMEVEFEKDAIGAEHRHPHEQYSYCMKGKFEFKLDGETVIVAEGDSLYIPGNVLHGVRALEPGILLDTFTPIREDLLPQN